MADKDKEASKGETKETPKSTESPLLAPKRAVEETATKDHKSFKESLGSKVRFVGLGALGAAALLIVGYMFIAPQTSGGDDVSATVSFPVVLLFGIVILLVGLAMPKFKRAPGIGSGVVIIGLLVILFAFLNSGFGKKAHELLTQAEACVGYGDCGDRADSFPTINNGSVVLRRGESKTFYAVGRVRLNNHENYCLNISPPEVFDISWTGDGRVYYIAPYNGEKELVTVTSKPARECRPM